MKDVHPSNEVSRILFDILSYFVNHPEANDTIEGIVQWWLLEQRIRQQIPVVEKALAVLVEKGFVLEQGGRNGHNHYRINRSQLDQIKAFLNRQKD